ncbi:hypothetical protein MANES_17G023547v8 [Manihot esculenta]|uniref:Uncharacterized protein n=1 Tax=Manihot esculenta TaxID=3983 RepID=A0ACB7G338_MANES|nr:hypothetical protein MANES_17G023547v8 [Manihot esculenta]
MRHNTNISQHGLDMTPRLPLSVPGPHLGGSHRTFNGARSTESSHRTFNGARSTESSHRTFNLIIWCPTLHGLTQDSSIKCPALKGLTQDFQDDRSMGYWRRLGPSTLSYSS